jgi:hypothetical protein
VPKVLKVLKVQLHRLLVHKVLLDPKAPKVLKVLKVPPVILAPKALRVLLVPRV